MKNAPFENTTPRPAGRLWAFAFVFVFSGLVNILMLTGPIFMLQIYDRVLPSGSFETLAVLFGLVTVLFLFMALLDYCRGRIAARSGAAFAMDMSARLNWTAGSEGGFGQQVRHLDTLRQFFASPVFLAVNDVIWVPFYLGLLFLLHPWLGWLGVAGGCVLLTIALIGAGLGGIGRKRREALGRSADAMTANLARSQELIRSQGMSTNALGIWADTRARAISADHLRGDLAGLASAASKSFRLYLQSAMLALGAVLVLQGQISAGVMVAASIIMGRAFAPMDVLLGNWNLVQAARSAWRAMTQAEQDKTKRSRAPAAPASVDANSVSVRFGQQEPALRAVSFALEPGMALGVIGKSGSGKSILARTLAGLVRPAMGQISISGTRLDLYPEDQLGRIIGYVPQSAELVPGLSIAQNIARLSVEPDMERVGAVTRQVGVHQAIMALQDGYDTIVDGQLGLAAGVVNGIALARALYWDPQVLLLDEPSAALDADSAEALSACFHRIKKKGGCVVIMTHRPAAISECDLLLVLEKGAAVSFGPRDEVLRSMMRNADDIQHDLRRAAQ